MNNNKVLFNNEERLSNIDKSIFENLRRAIKSKVMAEDETESNNVISPSRFNYLNNHKPFEDSIDINKEIVHNVTSSNKSTNSKGSTNISYTKERSKEPVRDRKTKTNRPNALTTTITGDSVIKKVFGDKSSRQLN